MSNKIGFFDSETEVTAEKVQETEQDAIQALFEAFLNPPEWIEDYETTLFWACVFNTQSKIYKA